MKFSKFLKTFLFTEHLWWLLLFSLKQKSKKEKIYSHEYIHASDSVLFSTVEGLRAYSFINRDSILDIFCEICEVLQNLIFAEDSWATASDFKQHFKHITCSISNQST